MICRNSAARIPIVRGAGCGLDFPALLPTLKGPGAVAPWQCQGLRISPNAQINPATNVGDARACCGPGIHHVDRAAVALTACSLMEAQTNGDGMATDPAKQRPRAALDKAIPVTVKRMSGLAIGSETSAPNRLKAVEMLLRVARTSHPSAADARAALRRALRPLGKVAATHPSLAINAKATRLIAAINKLRV